MGDAHVHQAMMQFNLFQRLNPTCGKPAFEKMDIKRCAELNSLQVRKGVTYEGNTAYDTSFAGLVSD
eukprot:1193353-Prorocentrum_minimum.AAC.1